jgi:hypothetical protein
MPIVLVLLLVIVIESSPEETDHELEHEHDYEVVWFVHLEPRGFLRILALSAKRVSLRFAAAPR